MNDPGTDIAHVRRVLARELDTINDYEAMARQASDPEVKAFLLHLAQEEKEHVAEATSLLRRLDAVQDSQFKKDFTNGHFHGAPAGTVPVALEVEIPRDPTRVLYALPAPPGKFAGAFTVGPLKRRDR